MFDLFCKYILSTIRTQSSDIEPFSSSIFLTFTASTRPLASFRSKLKDGNCSVVSLKMVMATVLKGVYTSEKNYNVVVKRNESTWWNTLGDLLAYKTEYY